ncbi:MAG TPA: SMP-30/gluconolactonase/LRE family protein [Polyangiaceae bacterium]
MNRLGSTLLVGLGPLLLGALAACGGNEPPAQPPPPTTATAMPEPPPPPTASAAPAASEAPAAPAAPAKPTPALSLHDQGFNTPESVLYDAKNDVYLVSNINGSPTATDNNGYISRVAPDGSKVEAKWIEAGKNGVKLDAPKGSAIVNGTLYVADITRLRTFDADSGKPKADIALPGCTFANDVTSGPDGKVYVSDTGIKFDDKGNPAPTKSDAVYVVDKGKAKTLAKGEDLGHPNGVLWSGDKADGKLWVVTFGTGEVYSLDKAGKKADAQKLPKGMLDGIVALGDASASYLVSSWEASGVFHGKPGSDWTLALTDLKAPADIGYDTKRGRVLVPLFMDSAVEAYTIP